MVIAFTTYGDNTCHRLGPVQPKTTPAGGTDVVTLTRMTIKRKDRLRAVETLAVRPRRSRDGLR